MNYSKEVHGIAAFIFNENKKCATVEEKEAKPAIRKEKGMFSFPLETSNKEEKPKKTFERLLYEELGIEKRYIDQGIIKIEIQSIIPIDLRIEHPSGITEIVTHLFVAKYFGPTNIFLEDDNDVQFHGWMTLEKLYNLPGKERRIEVRLIIDKVRLIIDKIMS